MATPTQRGAAIVRIAEQYVAGNIAWGQVNRGLAHLIHPSLDGLQIQLGSPMFNDLCRAVELLADENRGPLRWSIALDDVVHAVYPLVYGRGAKPCKSCDAHLASTLDELQPAGLASDLCPAHEAALSKAGA